MGHKRIKKICSSCGVKEARRDGLCHQCLAERGTAQCDTKYVQLGDPPAAAPVAPYDSGADTVLALAVAVHALVTSPDLSAEAVVEILRRIVGTP
jgi:hypothetical protein